MENFAAMNVLQCCANLDEPVENFFLLKIVLGLLSLLDVIGEVSNLTVLHDDVENVLKNEGTDVGNDIWMFHVS